MPDLLQVKLDILKIEIETINSAILNKDETTRQINNTSEPMKTPS